MSGYDVSPEKGEAAGCSSLLKKPLDGYALVRAIRNEIGWDDSADST